MAVLAKTIDMSREEWLSLRRKGIGGSEAAAIAGLNPWYSPMAVYLDKIGELPDNDEGNEAMHWGNILEDVVAREFAEINGFRVQRRNAILQHQEYPFMLANIDRYVFRDKQKGILEVKTTGAFNSAWDEDKLPDYVALQVHHYLAVTDLPYAYVAVLIGGQTYKQHYIERDQEIIDYLIKIESDFWKLVENRTPPELDGSQSSTEVLNILYKDSRPEQIELPPTTLELIQQYEQARDDEKAAKERKDEAANKLKVILGENEAGAIGERLVTWKQVISNRLDSKSLKSDLPDIYEKYCKESISRRFNVK